MKMVDREDGTTRTRRAVAQLAGIILLVAFAAGAQQPVPPPPTAGTLRVDVPVVNVYCTVKTDQGRLVSDLEASDFEIKEDGKRQEIDFFFQETDRPLTLALLVDTSISQQAVLPVEKESAHQFLQQVIRHGDLALLITFDVNVDLLQDFTADADRLHTALQRARINAPVDLGPIPRSGPAGTRLYDAVYLAAREKLGPEVGRRAIILVSDGYDAGSAVEEKEAIAAAHRAEVMIYAIGIGDPSYYRDRFSGVAGEGALKKLARETGATAIFPRNLEELRQAFDQIAAELRTQYLISYKPTNREKDGEFRKIEVKVKNKDMKVQARRGYYAPSS